MLLRRRHLHPPHHSAFFFFFFLLTTKPNPRVLGFSRGGVVVTDIRPRCSCGNENEKTGNENVKREARRGAMGVFHTFFFLFCERKTPWGDGGERVYRSSLGEGGVGDEGRGEKENGNAGGWGGRVCSCS